MIYKVPLRFTTLHFAQRFFIDEETFTVLISFQQRLQFLLLTGSFGVSRPFQVLPDQNHDYTCLPIFRPDPIMAGSK
jgi:hypothetical protein